MLGVPFLLLSLTVRRQQLHQGPADTSQPPRPSVLLLELQLPHYSADIPAGNQQDTPTHDLD
jgi:hypothetical protein